jgi:hypothetical protein
MRNKPIGRTNSFVVKTNFEAYEEQPHILRGTKPFVMSNNLEIYGTTQRLWGTKPFVMRNVEHTRNNLIG